MIDAGTAWKRDDVLDEARLLFSQIDADMKRRGEESGLRKIGGYGWKHGRSRDPILGRISVAYPL